MPMKSVILQATAYTGAFCRCARLASSATCAALLAAALTAPQLLAQSDNFDDGNDTGWLRSSVPPATFTFPADPLGGHAFRLQGVPGTTGDTNARAFAYLTNRLYTNFFAAVDVVAWNTNQDCNLVLGLLVRASSNEMIYPVPFNPSAPMGLTFNVRLHNWRAYATPSNAEPLGSRDQMSCWGMVNGGGTLMLGNPVTVSQIGFRWVPGRSYRLVMSNTNNLGDAPQIYTCSIYDCEDLTTPLLSMTGDDSYSGNYMFIPSYGYVGVFGYHLSNGDYDSTVDVTFDNFYVAERAPASVPAPATPHGLIGAPQVVNRSPGSFKNFHPAANGISFVATTLTTTNEVSTNAIRLFLNGVNVTESLVISGPTTNAQVVYHALASNVVYDARIELQDALGRRTTNSFTFDTFTDAYLASSAVKVIECEDYDYTTGVFMDNPPPSGYLTNGSGAVNLGVGYVEMSGTPGFDFYDRDGSPHTGESQYRSLDPVGTQQGNYDTFVYADSALGIGYSQTYDTQRGKYAAVDPALHEYIVQRTDGSEWLNYTRVFDGARTYNAYLRTACGLTQPVALEHIGSGPVTNLLGQFHIPSTFYLHNYRYVPLTTTNGTPALIQLNGTTTVRLRMDSPPNEATRYGLAMNYLLLTPAAPQLESAELANGSFAPEANALVDTAMKRITVPRNTATRFYQVAWSQQVTIASISVTRDNIVLTYE